MSERYVILDVLLLLLLGSKSERLRFELNIPSHVHTSEGISTTKPAVTRQHSYTALALSPSFTTTSNPTQIVEESVF